MKELTFYSEKPSLLKEGFYYTFGNGLYVLPGISLGAWGVDNLLYYGALYGALGLALVVPQTRSYVKWLDGVFRGRLNHYRESRWISEVLRTTMRNSKLSMVEHRVIERDGKKEKREVDVFPAVKIQKDRYNYYLTIRMLAGQGTDLWEKKAEVFASALRCKLVKSKIDRGVVYITLQHTQMRSDQVPYKFDDRHELTLGYWAGGRMVWSFDECPHMLIVGMTGSGKSTFMRNLFVQFWNDWNVNCIDGKFVEFTYLRDFGIAVAGEDDYFQYIKDAQAEVDRRFKALQDAKKNNYKELGMKPYFLVIDEFIYVAESLEAGKGKEREQMFSLLRDISLRGRAAGVFLILVLQRPDAAYLPTVIRNNLMCKVVLGSGSETAFEMAFGAENKRLTVLNKGEGYVMIEGELNNFSFPNYGMSKFIEDMGELSSPRSDRATKTEEATREGRGASEELRLT